MGNFPYVKYPEVWDLPEVPLRAWSLVATCWPSCTPSCGWGSSSPHLAPWEGWGQLLGFGIFQAIKNRAIEKPTTTTGWWGVLGYLPVPCDGIPGCFWVCLIHATMGNVGVQAESAWLPDGFAKA